MIFINSVLNALLTIIVAMVGGMASRKSLKWLIKLPDDLPNSTMNKPRQSRHSQSLHTVEQHKQIVVLGLKWADNAPCEEILKTAQTFFGHRLGVMIGPGEVICCFTGNKQRRSKLVIKLPVAAADLLLAEKAGLPGHITLDVFRTRDELASLYRDRKRM